MDATNNDILKALNDINDTLKCCFGIRQTQEEIKTELTNRIVYMVEKVE